MMPAPKKMSVSKIFNRFNYDFRQIRPADEAPESGGVVVIIEGHQVIGNKRKYKSIHFIEAENASEECKQFISASGIEPERKNNIAFMYCDSASPNYLNILKEIKEQVHEYR